MTTTRPDLTVSLQAAVGRLVESMRALGAGFEWALAEFGGAVLWGRRRPLWVDPRVVKRQRKARSRALRYSLPAHRR